MMRTEDRASTTETQGAQAVHPVAVKSQERRPLQPAARLESGREGPMVGAGELAVGLSRREVLSFLCLKCRDPSSSKL